MTIVAEVLVSKIVAEVESSSVVVPLVTPVVIGGGGGGADLSDATPAALGTAAAGTAEEASRADHVHAMPTAADVGALGATSMADLLSDLSGQAGAAFSLASQRLTTLAPATTVGDAEQYGQDGLRSILYASPSNTRKWRKAVASARRGTTRAHIAVIGDSIVQGYNGDTPYYQKSWANLLAGLMDGWLGASNDTGVIGPMEWVSGPASENRFTVASGWSFSSSLGGYQGFFNRGRAATLTSATLLFSPPEACDRFRIYYQNQSTFGGTWSWSIDSGAQTGTQASNGTTGLKTLDIAVSAGSGVHTLLLTPPGSSKNLYVHGIEAMIGTTGGCRVSRLSKNGVISSEAASAESLAQFAYIAPDLTIICLGANDFTAQTALATYNTHLTNLITNAKTTGDVLVMIWPQLSASGTITQAQYVAEAKAVAAANSVPVFDLQDRWGSYSTANGLGLMSDGTHPNGLGHYEIADAIFAAVQRLAAAGNDARLSDARTPAAHAASHADGGSDEVTLAESQVTGLTAALAGKADLASPTLTGVPTAPTAAPGTDTTQVATTAFVLANSVTPPITAQVLVTDPNGADLATGDGKAYLTVPAAWNGKSVLSIHAGLTTASSSGTPTVQVARIRGGTPVDVLSTAITIDANELNSYTAATPPVVNTANDDLSTGDLLRVDTDVAGTGAKGLMVMIAVG